MDAQALHNSHALASRALAQAEMELADTNDKIREAENCLYDLLHARRRYEDRIRQLRDTSRQIHAELVNDAPNQEKGACYGTVVAEAPATDGRA